MRVKSVDYFFSLFAWLVSCVFHRSMRDDRVLVTDLRALLEKDFEEVVMSLTWHYPTSLEVLIKITDVSPSHNLI